MNTQLSQLTLDKLRAFASRRRVLIAARGFCVGIVSLLMAMSVVALVDALFVIKSQSLRWTLSIAGYGVVAVIVWMTCLRSLLRIPGPRDLARLVEQAAPGLREDLVSAVELGSPTSDPRYDSPVFRALLQASVERRLSGVRVDALLPGGLIRGAALAATGALIVCVALLLVPDLHFAHRLTRALLPSAPLDRVSFVQVRIIAPSPADALAPHNDAVKVVVELSGGEADGVIVETFRGEDDEQDETIALKSSGGARRFAGVIQVGRDDVRYRVLAGDAVTRMHTIRTGARPHPVAFRKAYQYPKYTSLEPRTVEEKHGHLEAIEGTQVDLIIDTDQPITGGELRMEADAKSPAEPIVLVRIDDQQWRATVPVTESTLYRVHVVAKATGFDNAFDPPYEIKATPDEPPVVEVESPLKDIVAPAGDAVAVRLSARDDTGLRTVEQQVRINGGDWSPLPLAENAGRQWSTDRRWELYDLNLRAGDQVATRFAAIDGAGQKTETPPVTITIADRGFKADRLAGIEAKRRVLASLASLRSAMAAGKKAASDGAARWAKAGEIERGQIVQAVAAADQAARDEADACLEVIASALKANPAAASAAELVALGTTIGRVRHELIGVSLAELAPAARAAGAAEPISDVRESLALAACEKAEQAFAQLVAFDEAEALLRDLLKLEQEQAAIDPAKSPDDAASWQRLARRQRLVTAQAKDAEALATALAACDKASAEPLGRVIKRLSAARADAERALVEQTRAVVTQQHERVSRALSEAIGDVQPVVRSLSRQVPAAHEALDEDADALARTMAPLLDSSRPSAGAKDDPHWLSAQERLKSAGGLHESRSDADAAFVADIGLLRRALVAIEKRLATEPPADVRPRVERVAAAFRTLEAGHGAAELHTLATAQASYEKWRRDDSDAVTRVPREWLWITHRVARTGKAMEASGLVEKATALVSALPRSGPSLIVDTEMAARRLKARVSQRRHAQFEQLAAELAQAQTLIAPQMAEARAIIAAEAPTLPQMMAALARDVKELEKKAAQAAEEEASAADAAELQKEQKAVDAKLADVTEALRHDANAQDAMTDEGRERARDADDAAAMLRDPATKAAGAMDRAAAAEASARREAELKTAAEQESKLAAALNKLAEHYENAAKGQAEETRSALREAERELGIKRDMDAQYGRMQRLAELAEKPAAEQMAELERELDQNDLMQAELSELSQDAAASAKRSLDEAAAQERRLAQELAEAQRPGQRARPDVAGRMRDLAQKADQLSGRTESIAASAKKGTADDAAASSAAAGEALKRAGDVPPPADAEDQKGAAMAARQLAEKLREAAEKLKAAEQQATKAGDRVRKEEADATTKLAIGNATNEERVKAATTMLHAKPRQDANRRAAAEAKIAAERAADLAAAAEELAAEANRAAGAGEEAIDEALKQQPAIAEALGDAHRQVARAARHEERLGKPKESEVLSRAAEGIKNDGLNQVKHATETLAHAKEAMEAKPAVEQAQAAIARQAARLEDLTRGERGSGRVRGGESGGQPTESADREEDAAKWMARALDELDQNLRDAKEGPAMPLSPQAVQRMAAAGAKPQGAGNQSGEDNQGGESGSKPSSGSPSSQASGGVKPGGAQGSGQASQAVGEAAKSQQTAMAQARQQGGAAAGGAMASSRGSRRGGQPKDGPRGEGGEAPGGEGSAQAMASNQGGQSGQGRGASGSGNRGNASETGALPKVENAKHGEWGKLPTRLARELMEGQRDEVPAEYRSQVEAYFRAIAEKAKGK